MNLTQVLEKLRPLLETRLHQSHLTNWTGQFILDAGDQKASLLIKNGRMQVTQAAIETVEQHIIRGGPAIARLIIGSDAPDEIIQQEKMTCTGMADEMVRVLFPNMHPMLSHWDEY